MFLTVSNTSPFASNNSNSNISLTSVFPLNVFFPLNVISPLAVYSFLNVTSNVALPLGLKTSLPFPSSTNVNVTTLSVESYLTPLIVSPLCVSLIVYVYVPASV